MQQPATNKSLGQHWLNDAVSLHAMLAAGDVQPEDTVLEVGPGPGALTKLLVDSADQVVAVEFDPYLAADLPRRVPARNLRIVHSDILRFDLTTMPAEYKVVANIPYYLTSKLVRVLSESPNPPSLTVLLIQKEVAERLAAEPGELSILGVTAQFYWDISLDMVVPAELFTPPPKVDSQIVVMRRRSDPAGDLVRAAHATDASPAGQAAAGATGGVSSADFDVRAFFRVVKAGFGARRKTLLNSLAGGLHLNKQQTTELLAKAGINPQLRAQNLSLPEWYTLYDAYRTTTPSAD